MTPASRRIDGRPAGRTRFRPAAAIAAGLLLVAAMPTAASYKDAVEAYDNGRIDEAVAEWQRLAEAGEADSQVALADMILSGWVPGAGLPEAVALLRRAANSGHPVAQLNLADFLARGHGVPRDRVAAHAWFGLAAAQGRVWAAQRRQELAAGMSAEELARSQELANRLVP